MNNFSSPLDEIHTAIKSYNPFRTAGIVTEQHIWGKGFPDLTSLNKEASDTVFEALNQVKNSQAIHEKVTTLVWIADQGVGKSHSLKRIRQQLEQNGGGLFVYGNVNKFTDLNLIKYHFQQILAESLAHPGSQGVSQWQEVAVAMVKEFNGLNASPLQIVKKFDRAYTDFLKKKGESLINNFSKKVLDSQQGADVYVVRAILWTLSPTYSPFAIKWLAGDALDQETANILGLPANNKTDKEKESESLKSILQILKLVSHYNSVIICFDEIESLKVNDAGFKTSQVIAELVHNLYNSLMVSDLGQGVVILTVVLPDIWENSIKPMVGGIRARLSNYTPNKEPIQLNYPNDNSIVDLVALWLQEQLYHPRQLTPPHRVHPFNENELRVLAKQKLSVREVLAWCAEHFDVEEPLPDDPSERFKIALEQVSQSLPENYFEDNKFIGQVLVLGFQTLKGECLEGETKSGEKLNSVVIQEIIEVFPKSQNAGWINFKIIGQEKDKTFKIGVAVIQQINGLSVGAGIKRLSDYQTFDLTRGCLVRSPDRKIRKKWDSFPILNEMVEQRGGEWVHLYEEDLKPLVHIYSVFQQRENYQLSEEQVLELAKGLTKENPLLLEILSDPSGHLEVDDIGNISSSEEDIVLFSNDDTDQSLDSDDFWDLFGDDDDDS